MDAEDLGPSWAQSAPERSVGCEAMDMQIHVLLQRMAVIGNQIPQAHSHIPMPWEWHQA